MIQREGERMLVSGPVTLANVSQVLDEGYAAIRDGAGAIDLAGVTELDSSLLAMLLAWLRAAAQAGRTLRLDNLPGGLITLAQLYGVDELLPAAHTKH
ncbi:MAG TPA: STAS domain-containing protein [Burkholderiales bacterium]|jgi:phospholipid transport system transporter-binding protein|nr:STAS domain-containing protein [Burkholderiales bacterium]